MLIDRIMKKYKYFIILSLLVIGLTGCKDDEAEIGEPYSKIEGLTATDWIVEEVYLVDESNPAKPEKSVTEYYTSGDTRMEMDFKTDGTFTVTSGDGLNFFPPSGTWSFDYDAAPTKIILISDEGVVTDAPLAGPTRITDAQLKIQIVHSYCQVEGESKGVLGYRIVFNRKSA